MSDLQRLKDLQLCLKAEIEKQKAIEENLQKVKNETEKFCRQICCPMEQKYPILTLSTSILRKFKSFAIYLIAPIGYFNTEQAYSLWKEFKVRKFTAPDQDIVQCTKCKTKLTFSHSVLPNQTLERFAWLDCRFHCNSSKLHFGEELFICMNINGLLIKSPGFVSVVRVKDEVKRRHVESLSYELTLHSEPSIHFNATATACVLLYPFLIPADKPVERMLRRQSLRSFARNAKGFLKIKLANIGTSDVHAILFTFDCEENLKNFLSTLVYYLRNEWIFKNHELTNLIDNLAPQFIDLYCSYAPGDGRESFFHSMNYFREDFGRTRGCIDYNTIHAIGDPKTFVSPMYQESLSVQPQLLLSQQQQQQQIIQQVPYFNPQQQNYQFQFQQTGNYQLQYQPLQQKRQNPQQCQQQNQFGQYQQYHQQTQGQYQQFSMQPQQVHYYQREHGTKPNNNENGILTDNAYSNLQRVTSLNHLSPIMFQQQQQQTFIQDGEQQSAIKNEAQSTIQQESPQQYPFQPDTIEDAPQEHKKRPFPYRWQTEPYSEVISNFNLDEELDPNDYDEDISRVHLVELEQQLAFHHAVRSDCKPPVQIEPSILTRNPMLNESFTKEGQLQEHEFYELQPHQILMNTFYPMASHRFSPYVRQFQSKHQRTAATKFTNGHGSLPRKRSEVESFL